MVIAIASIFQGADATGFELFSRGFNPSNGIAHVVAAHDGTADEHGVGKPQNLVCAMKCISTFCYRDFCVWNLRKEMNKRFGINLKGVQISIVHTNNFCLGFKGYIQFPLIVNL